MVECRVTGVLTILTKRQPILSLSKVYVKRSGNRLQRRREKTREPETASPPLLEVVLCSALFTTLDD